MSRPGGVLFLSFFKPCLEVTLLVVSLFIVCGAFRLVSLFCVGYSITTILPFVGKTTKKKLTIKGNAVYEGDTLVYQARDATDLLLFVTRNFNPDEVEFEVISWTAERLRALGYQVS